MTAGPRLDDQGWPPEYRRQREAVYRATEDAELALDEETGIEPTTDIAVEGLEPFAVAAITTAGWDMASLPELVFALDVPDDSDWSGWVDPDTWVIHLHPRLLTAWTVLHELAHWIDRNRTHDARFCSTLLVLVRAGLGARAHDLLLDACVERGAEFYR